MRAKHAGYSFPDRIFEQFPVITMDSGDLKAFQDISKESTVHYGEAEELSIALEKGAIFLTDDQQIIRFAEKVGINAMDMKDLLTLLAIRRVLGIEIQDNTSIKYKDEILGRYITQTQVDERL
ncbi:MAG: hypothetical protein ACE14P_15330 [Methanotrichaceae archaeon]